jgi:hypothetical protein
MTVMIGLFFGVPQFLIRTGLYKKMRPSSRDLYLALLHESERYCTREIKRTDKQISELVGLSLRSIRNARTKLCEYHLVELKYEPGGAYTYILCDPKTGVPYAGDPRQPVIRPRNAKPLARALKQEVPPAEYTPTVDTKTREDSSMVRGVPLDFP